MNTNSVSNRVVGQYPLSIATSLAIEGLQGIHPDHPEKTTNDFPHYDVIWVNLKTIFRNLYQAIERDEILQVSPDELYVGFDQEIVQFERLMMQLSDSRLSVVWYVSNYAGMNHAYPNAILRGDTTLLQKAYTAAMISTISAWLKNNNRKAKIYSIKITDSEPRKALILTHYPLDLFASGFRSLTLLESHTGALKSKHTWYTKYLDGSGLSQIPFTEQFIQVFGDKEHFRPMSVSIRRKVLEIAEKYNWSSVTTQAKINYGLDQLSDKYLRDQLKELR